MSASIWTTPDRRRFYLLSDSHPPGPGDVQLRRLDGATTTAIADELAPFEISEEQAHRIARDQLGETLEELNAGLKERLGSLRASLTWDQHTPVAPDSPITPDAAPALLALLKALPGVIAGSLAKDGDQLDRAREKMAVLQRRLGEAGIDLDERFGGFPDRLASLRAAQPPVSDKEEKADDRPPPSARD